MGPLAASALIAAPAEAATHASAKVVKLPRTVSANPATAKAKVSYRCTNDAGTTYYLLAGLAQGTPGTNSYAYYGQGQRNAPGTGPTEATCTGKTVKQTIVLYTYATGAGTVPLAKGRATLDITLSSRAPGYYGYYGEPGTGPSVTATRTVKVKVTR